MLAITQGGSSALAECSLPYVEHVTPEDRQQASVLVEEEVCGWECARR